MYDRTYFPEKDLMAPECYKKVRTYEWVHMRFNQELGKEQMQKKTK